MCGGGYLFLPGRGHTQLDSGPTSTWLSDPSPPAGSGAERSLVCLQQTCCTSLAYLWLSCVLGAALLTQSCMVTGQVRQKEKLWYAVSLQCHLCVCYCGICSSSITDTHGLSVLKAKSHCKPHLVCQQSGAQTQHIFLFVREMFWRSAASIIAAIIQCRIHFLFNVSHFYKFVKCIPPPPWSGVVL